LGKYHPFTEAFNSWKDHIGKKKLADIRTFSELTESVKAWGGKKVPMTRKQEKAIAEEGEALGIYEHIREEKYFRDGKLKTRYRDVITGHYAKSMNERSILPNWKKSDTMTEKGVKINIKTGERMVIRDEKGKFLKKSEWRIIDKEGKETKL
jgi:hypothetical protein